ncbi:hypothetical protein CBA19CS22_06310 [Caballeronia novacaledonica]|uniref:Uncharacterized protein n=1 Tax=Caballeronia novacaledonica TaxID=1544861 RepID=A0ACB5QMF4_9BURK|nr:hypothetical protein CBA19CS22_06310 [Caballeronia novacaledonica]
MGAKEDGQQKALRFDHVIVLMLENWFVDHLFGCLAQCDQSARVAFRESIVHR